MSRSAPALAREGVLPGRFATDDSYRIQRPEGTSDWLLIFTYGGAGRVIGAGFNDVRATRGTALAFQPGTPHDYGTEPGADRWEIGWAHVAPSPMIVQVMDWPRCAPGIGRIDLPPLYAERAQSAMDRAVGHFRSGLPQRRALTLNAIEEAVLWCANAYPGRSSLDPMVFRVIEYASTHLDRPHSVDSLARFAGVSGSHLSHLFKDNLGLPVMRYITQQRIDTARDLLDSTTLPIGEIARHVGYSDPLHFSRAFRRTAGVSPRAWRARKKG